MKSKQQKTIATNARLNYLIDKSNMDAQKIVDEIGGGFNLSFVESIINKRRKGR